MLNIHVRIFDYIMIVTANSHALMRNFNENCAETFVQDMLLRIR